MKRIIFFILLIPIFAFNFFATSWTGSYIMFEEDWKNHIVFTPENATEPEQIYEIDKLIYGFKYEPMSGIVCVLSFLMIIGLLVFWFSKKFRNKTKIIEN